MLSILVEAYEQDHFHFALPDPIDAIRFKMDEKELRQVDLVPMIGSRSKVSEVLARKRPLTLSMIRALSRTLNLSADILLQDTSNPWTDREPDWNRFPLMEMRRRGWIKASAMEIRTQAERLMKNFLEPVKNQLPMEVLFKGSFNKRFDRDIDPHGLVAWATQVLRQATEHTYPDYRPGSVDANFMESIVRLSWAEEGPLLAQEFLANHGISLVIVPHLPRTTLDGCSMIADGRPVIGMTLRFDRIDNFWFVLTHELAHVFKHLDGSQSAYFDDLQSHARSDQTELEADDVALNALIPRSEWASSNSYCIKSVESILDDAQRWQIHPAIIAGRIRHDTRNYRILNQLVGHGLVRKLFTI